MKVMQNVEYRCIYGAREIACLGRALNPDCVLTASMLKCRVDLRRGGCHNYNIKVNNDYNEITKGVVVLPSEKRANLKSYSDKTNRLCDRPMLLPYLVIFPL